MCVGCPMHFRSNGKLIPENRFTRDVKTTINVSHRQLVYTPSPLLHRGSAARFGSSPNCGRGCVGDHAAVSPALPRGLLAGHGPQDCLESALRSPLTTDHV